MKKTLIALTTFACFSNLACAETNGFYLGGQLGATILKVSDIEDTLHYRSRIVKDDIFDSMHKTKLAGALNLGYNLYDYGVY
ncbi:hypothetical protein A9G42_04280 [Gilliamella sp. Nev6-6]|uniref:hypothetical protein n=1 Tax=Gilliamella sp. Nev6-6 TaxID=3120252 RepID=UPI00080F53AE|nr:hypothetical protein [Gilliamella apicola]OCG78283.1 hypothetical protein A9G42_04280 [Gilliamella apicola]